MPVPDAAAEDEQLNAAEGAFLEAVLLCHGVTGLPTQLEFQRALEVMHRYAQQVQDNPPEGQPSPIIKRWLSGRSDEDRIMIAAVAFVRFGATKPSIFQVRAAHRELFDADLTTDQLT